jgi:hypothetical protein
VIRTENVLVSNTENLRELGAGSVGPAFYCAYWTLSDFGDFVVGQSCRCNKNKRFSLIWGEKG